MALRLTAGRLSLELRPETGGCVSAARLGLGARDFDLMRPLGGSSGSAPDALHASMFPMAPFASCIHDNRFAFDGRTYCVSPNMTGVRLNFHGSGWRSTWRVGSVDSRSAELLLEDGRVDDVYRYAAAQRFRIDAGGITVETELVNRGKTRMPFTFGLHPWFPLHGGRSRASPRQRFGFAMRTARPNVSSRPRRRPIIRRCGHLRLDIAMYAMRPGTARPRSSGRARASGCLQSRTRSSGT